MNYNWFIRNFLYRIKGFTFKSEQRPVQTVKKVIFFMDANRKYPGFVDLLKAIIGSYYIAKTNGYEFKIHFESPFQLSKYLVPPLGGTNWMLTKEEIAHINELPFSVGLLNYYGIGSIPKLHKDLYQVRNFIGWNILQRNNLKGWSSVWTKLFLELFEPTEYLQNNLHELLLPENSYVGVHVRFVNALELAEIDYPQKPLCGKEKILLMEECVKTIKNIEDKEKTKAIVFSDSPSFLNYSIKNGLNVCGGKVGHITYNQTDDVILKMFTDLYAISRAKKTFMLRGNNLYASAFPLYASLIGSKHPQIINITTL